MPEDGVGNCPNNDSTPCPYETGKCKTNEAFRVKHVKYVMAYGDPDKIELISLDEESPSRVKLTTEKPQDVISTLPADFFPHASIEYDGKALFCSLFNKITNNHDNVRECFGYDHQANSWYKFPSMVHTHARSAFGSMGKKLWAATGFEGTVELRQSRDQP